MTGNDETLGWADRDVISSNFHFSCLFREIFVLKPTQSGIFPRPPPACGVTLTRGPSPTVAPRLDKLAHAVPRLRAPGVHVTAPPPAP